MILIVSYSLVNYIFLDLTKFLVLVMDLFSLARVGSCKSQHMYYIYISDSSKNVSWL